MTKRRALHILIEHAARDARGTGTGIRPTPTEAERLAIVRAIQRLWNDAYNHDCTEDDLRNLGLRLDSGL